MTEPTLATDIRWLRRALDLARPWAGRTRPNPPVGCVLVAPDGTVIAEGWHERPGEAHAEAMALDRAGHHAAGATAVVTLEPCNHHGRTPPCAAALVTARVARVVYAVADPDPIAQHGAATLRAAGIAVDGPDELRAVASDATRDELDAVLADCADLVAPWRSATVRGRPWVVAKWAMSLDGRIATRTGESQWISGEAARAHAQRMRAVLGAVAVGSGTVLADNPLLTWRGDDPFPQPVRIIFDGRGRTPATCRLVASAAPDAPVIVVTPTEVTLPTTVQVLRVPPGPDGRGVDLAAALPLLTERFGVQGLLLEGGRGLLGAAFDAGRIDRVGAYIAPVLIGGTDAPGPLGGTGIAAIADALRLTHPRLTQLGRDWLIEGNADAP